MSSFREIIRPIVVVALIGIFAGGSLGVMDNYSKEKIELNLNEERKKAVLYTLNIPYADKSAQEIEAVFQSTISDRKLRGIHYYVYYQEDVIKAYSFPFQGKGLWGSIAGYISVDAQAQTLLGLVFTEHSETPGLGGRMDEAWYKEQFRGIDIDREEPFVIYGGDGEDSIDSITGATLTSDALLKLINDSILEIRTIVKEDLNE